MIIFGDIFFIFLHEYPQLMFYRELEKIVPELLSNTPP